MGSPDVEVLLRQHSRLTDLTSKTNDVQFARMMLDIPTADQADNFTVGTLGTKNGFGDGPAVASSISEKTMIAVYYLGAAFTGHKGYVHGGALATLLDESCGRAALCHFQGQKDNGATTTSAAVTAKLGVTYISPIKTESCVLVQAVISPDGLSQRKAKVKADLWTLGPDGQDTLSCSAECVFIEPKM